MAPDERDSGSDRGPGGDADPAATPQAESHNEPPPSSGDDVPGPPPAASVLAHLDTPVALLASDGAVLESSPGWGSEGVDLRTARRWVLEVTSGARDWIEVPLPQPDGASVRITRSTLRPPITAVAEVVRRGASQTPGMAVLQAVRDVEGEVVDLHLSQVNDAGARWLRSGATPAEVEGHRVGSLWPDVGTSPFLALAREVLAADQAVSRPISLPLDDASTPLNLMVDILPLDSELMVAMWRNVEVGSRPQPADLPSSRSTVVAQLGERALAGASVDELEADAAQLVGESLGASAAAVLAISPGGASSVRAGWRWDHTVDAATVAAESGSWMSAMIRAERHDTRLLVVCSSESGAFDADEAELVHAVADVLAAVETDGAPPPQAADAVEEPPSPSEAELLPEDRPRVMEPGRHAFAEALAEALEELADRRAERSGRHGGRVGVLDIDLHELPLLCSGLNRHEAVDLVAAALSAIEHTVGEQGSVVPVTDERVWVLVPRAARAVDVLDVADRVVAAMEHPLTVGAREIAVPVSVGVALARLGEERPDELIDRADAALSLARQRGPSTIQLFTDEVGDQARRRITTAKELRAAGANNELVLHWQPLVDLADGRPVGAEALLRWQHPRRGLLRPADFLSVAETSGQLGSIGRFVLETACRQLRRWLDDDIVDADFMISVNLAPQHLARPDLAGSVQTILESAGVRPTQVCVEVTESALLTDVDHALDNALRLRELGVELAIDDFGTGYSSLAQLRRLPVATVKLDRAFVADLDTDPSSASLVDGVIKLAHGLGLKTVAEGAERSEQVEVLRASGCQLGQGYWWTPPLPGTELAAWLTARSTKVGPAQTRRSES